MNLKRIGFSGVPSTGKTTLARTIASELGKDYNIEVISEYARRYISKHKAVTEVWEQIRILEKQLEWEENVVNDKLNLILTDCPIMLSFCYALELRKDRDVLGYDFNKEDMLINDLFKKLNRLNPTTKRRYDIVFHLDPFATTLVDDGLRPSHHLQEDWRKDMDRKIKNSLELFPPRQLITVNEIKLEDKISVCKKAILELLKNDG